MSIDSSGHPLNSSPSKQRFSFCKAERFLPPVAPMYQNSELRCDKYYDVSDIRPKRTTSFGIGNKLQPHTRNDDAPSPDRYHIHTEFDDSVKLKNRGFSFGYGRQLYGGPMEVIKYSKEIPGPGQYPLSSTLKKNNITLKSRIEKSLGRANDIPGPGMYDLPSSINPQGKYFSSKFINSKCPKFLPQHEHHSSESHLQIPGPGAYQPRTSIRKDGKFPTSKFQNIKVRSFPKGPRLTTEIYNKDIPGPGSYKLFSPFDNNSSFL